MLTVVLQLGAAQTDRQADRQTAAMGRPGVRAPLNTKPGCFLLRICVCAGGELKARATETASFKMPRQTSPLTLVRRRRLPEHVNTEADANRLFFFFFTVVERMWRQNQHVPISSCELSGGSRSSSSLTTSSGSPD